MKAFDELAALAGCGEAVLFTGAGFSRDARDLAGRPLPGSDQMAQELWSLLFDDAPHDGSTLADLYDVAIQRAPDALADYLRERLTVDPASLPSYYASWFAAPWRRVYTLNVDDLERAAADRFALPRPLDVIHLNGVIDGRVERATFSTCQYASRLLQRDPAYEQLCADLAERPFVFVGTVLDEPIFWQHLESLLRTGIGRDRPQSILVTRSLTRARTLLLDGLRIRWVQGTASEAARALAPLRQSA
jgi:hypothetical protein